MNTNDQIQSSPNRDPSAEFRSGRAWVRRDFDLWTRCTIELDNGDRVTVALDNLDELTVDRDDVRQFEPEPGSLVFHQHWPGSLGGYPVVLRAIHGEVAEIEFPDTIYRESERSKCLLRDLRVYDGVPIADCRVGTRTFAYKAIQWRPALFLFFPALVREIFDEVGARVEFGDGENAIVPITLLQKPDLKVGEVVYTCTSFVSHGTNPDERWGPCRIVSRDDKRLTLRDALGSQFDASIDLIAILPAGYRMVDGKFEKIADDVVPESSPSYVHIIRSDRLEDAADQPITKDDVDALLAADPECRWATSDQITANAHFGVKAHPYTIFWNGYPCFWWHRHDIRCENPTDTQLAKLIDLAIRLDANVVGGDGHEYH